MSEALSSNLTLTFETMYENYTDIALDSTLIIKKQNYQKQINLYNDSINNYSNSSIENQNDTINNCSLFTTKELLNQAKISDDITNKPN